MTHDYYILKGREVKIAADATEWGEWFEKNPDRIIRQTVTKRGYRVSTVFLGVDYNFENEGEPILFETMVFYNSPKKVTRGELDMERYRTYSAAEVGHELMVQKWSSRRQVLKHRLGAWWFLKKLKIKLWFVRKKK